MTKEGERDFTFLILSKYQTFLKINTVNSRIFFYLTSKISKNVNKYQLL